MNEKNFEDHYTAMLEYLWDLTDKPDRFVEQREYIAGFIEASKLAGIISQSAAEFLHTELYKIPYSEEV